MSIGFAELILIIIGIIVLICPDKLPTLLAMTKKISANVTEASSKVKEDMDKVLKEVEKEPSSQNEEQ